MCIMSHDLLSKDHQEMRSRLFINIIAPNLVSQKIFLFQVFQKTKTGHKQLWKKKHSMENLFFMNLEEQMKEIFQKSEFSH